MWDSLWDSELLSRNIVYNQHELAEEAGVEPTKSRLATLPGFEVRTPHRGRFSSAVTLDRADHARQAGPDKPGQTSNARPAATSGLRTEPHGNGKAKHPAPCLRAQRTC